MKMNIKMKIKRLIENRPTIKEEIFNPFDYYYITNSPSGEFWKKEHEFFKKLLELCEEWEKENES